MKINEATEIVRLLVNTFHPSDWREENTTAYAMLIADLDKQAAMAAALKLCQNERWMPMVVDIRAAVVGEKLSAAQAWELVQREISRVGYLQAPTWPDEVSDLMNAAIATMGGWQAICGSETPMADRAHFLKMFDQLATREFKERVISPAVRIQLDGLADRLSLSRGVQSLEES